MTHMQRTFGKMRTIIVQPRGVIGNRRKVLVVHAPVKPFRADRVQDETREVEANPMAAEMGRVRSAAPMRFPCALLPSALGRTGS